MKRSTLVLTMLTALTIAACGGGSDGYGYDGGVTPPPPPPPTDPRTIQATPSLTFGPSTLDVNVGDVVTFAFGSVQHNVFFDATAGAPADITGVNANVSVTRTFSTAGTFHYTCHIHPGMQGTVVVH